jgi:hypothetical protein
MSWKASVVSIISLLIASCFAQEDICTFLAKENEKEAVINCTADNVTKWSHNGKYIPHDPTTYEYRNQSLVIKKVDYSKDLGIWECTAVVDGSEVVQNVTLAGVPVIKRFPESKNLVEGDPLVLNCIIEGSNPAVTQVEWLVGGQPLNDPRVTLSENNGVENATLRLEDTTFDDKNDYTCVAANECGNGTSTIHVRIKDKLAALWPFLGICAEVAILCTIIFFYERRRAKKHKEEMEKDAHEGEALANSHADRDDVRQRKA